MCGEHPTAHRVLEHDAGSSPHVRGARLARRMGRNQIGIIPACAGSTSRCSSTRRRSRDHPRMCGEHPMSLATFAADAGSSPHVRGALQRDTRLHRQRGIIPACAGSTTSARPSAPKARDHPRMCGEHNPTVESLERTAGSSPHVRGAHRTSSRRVVRTGIIPACAGSTWRQPVHVRR